MDNIDYGNMLTGVTRNLDNNMKWLGEDNDMIKLFVVLVVVYAVFFVGKVFPPAMNIAKRPFVKLALFISIALVARYNVPLAFVLTIAIVSIMMTNLKNTNEFMTAGDAVYRPMKRGYICRCNETGCQCLCPKTGRRCPQAEAEAEAEMEQEAEAEAENVMAAQEAESQEQDEEEQQAEAEAEMEEEDERCMLMNFNKKSINTIERQMIDHEIQKNKGSLRDLDNRIYIPNSSPTPQDLYSYSVDMDYSPVKF